MFAVWDDCLCFPDLLVKVRRHRSCRIRYRDPHGHERERFLEDDLSELLQHEYDHLDGILAVSRAIDGRSLALRGQKPELIETYPTRPRRGDRADEGRHPDRYPRP